MTFRFAFADFKSTFLNQKKLNQDTINNVGQLNELVNQKMEYNDFLSHLKQWQGPQNFQIHNSRFGFYLFFAVVALILGVTIYPYLVLLTFAFVIYAFIQRQSPTAYQHMLIRLEEFTLSQKYQLQFETTESLTHLPQLQHFPLFKLGNDENEILNSAYGVWRIQGSNYPFKIFNYHYVDRIERRDAEGKKKVEYEHHDLWGIQMFQIPLQGISISRYQKRACRLGVKWESIDIQFNQRYQQSGTNEMLLAKFFSPSHILKLDQALQAYSGDLYIHPDYPSLVWLFKQDILKRQPDLEDIRTINDLAYHLEQLSMPEFEHFQSIATSLFEEILHR